MKDIEPVVDHALTVVAVLVVGAATFVFCTGGGGAFVAAYLALRYFGVTP